MASGMDVMSSGGREPFVGRRAFDFRDQDIFFGRHRECDELQALWAENSLVVLHGPSGSGKTSLVQAGLAPALREIADVLLTGCVSLGSSFPEAVLPDHNPYTLAVLSSWSPAESRTNLSQLSFTDFFRDRALTSGWSGAPTPIFAAIDQLEEIFVDTRGARHRDEFFDDLASAVQAVPRLRVLLATRSEFLAELARHKEPLAIRDQAYFPLPALNRDAAIDA